MASSVSSDPLAYQGEVLQTLFDAFKVLTEENVRKDKKIDTLERNFEQLREFIFVNIMQTLGLVKQKIVKFEKMDQIESDIELVKSGVADLKFSRDLMIKGGSVLGSASPAASKFPLPTIATTPAMGSLEKLHESLEQILHGIEFMGSQRNSDVEAINTSLDRLDGRVKKLGEQVVLGGGIEETKRSVPGSTLSQLSHKVKMITDEALPLLESEWADKWKSLSFKLEKLQEDGDRHRADYVQFSEKHVIKESRLFQMLTQAEEFKRDVGRATSITGEMSSRVNKMESDIGFLMEEIKRLEAGAPSAGVAGQILESKLELARAENKSNWERVNRQTKQDVDALRIKIERLSLLRDEFERLSSDVKNMHELVTIPGNRALSENRPLTPSFSNNKSPMIQIVNNQPQNTIEDSSLLSVIDEAIGTNPGVIHRISSTGGGPGMVSLPQGVSESTGSLRIDVPTNRVLWRVDNVDSMLREPSRFPKILISPEFSSYSESKPLDMLVGRLKLFPFGSDQSKLDGFCSFYLRCLPGVVVRFAIDVGGDAIETFECEYEKQRDKGKHDLVRLADYVQPDGSVIFGLEIRAIRSIGN